MNLVPKLSLTFIAAVSLVLAANGYLRVKREVALFENDRIRDDVQVGRTLAAAVTTVFQTDGEARAMALVRHADAQEGRLRVRWVSLSGDLDPPVAAARAMLLETPAGTSRTFVGMDPSRGEQRYTIVPVPMPEEPTGALEVSESMEPEHAYIRTTILDTIATTLTLALVCGALAMLVGALLVGRPMALLVEKARRVGDGDFDAPLHLTQTDEISRLANEMNAMCDRLVAANARATDEMRARVEVLEQLRHADRLVTVGKLASGVAHELGTPLNVIEARASMIASGDTTPEESASYAKVVIRSVERMTRIVRQLLAFARPSAPEKSRCDLVTLAQRTVEMLRPLAAKRLVTLDVKGASPAYAYADPGQLEQVLTNLTMNATQAMDHSGRVELTIDRARETPPADVGGGESEFLRIRVRDEGQGIAPENLGRLFEPFFTTKEVGEGTGLGLAVTYGIVRDHGGWLGVTSELGRGSTFTVHLPVALATHAARGALDEPAT